MISVKARLATVLSLTGVLVAGSAAALVNTQVLNSSTEDRNTVQLAGQTTLVGSSLPPLTVPIVTSGGSTVLECLGAYAQFFCSKPEPK